MSTATPSPAASPAARLQAPSWRDPRLVVGLLLVLSSVLVGTRVVAAADSTTPVWAAARTLVPGQEVTLDALRVVRVHLEGGTAGYLPAAGAPPAGLVALREVSSGDLLPRSAVGAADALQTRPVGLPVSGPLPSGLVAGALVDVWVTPAVQRSALAAALTGSATGSAGGSTSSGAGSTGSTGAAGTGAASGTAPWRLAAGAGVAEVSTDGGSFTASRGVTVQVELDPDELQQALEATAADATVSLVLVPGSTPAKG